MNAVGDASAGRVWAGRWHLLTRSGPALGPGRVAVIHGVPVEAGDLMGSHLLVGPTCRSQIHLAPDVTMVAVDMNAATKVLAFHDHVAGPAPRPSSGTRIVSCAVPVTLGSSLSVDQWLMQVLASRQPEFHPVLQALRQAEGYRLVCYLLSQCESATVSDLSIRYGLSPSHFRRLCRSVLGRTLKSEMRHLRAARSLMACSAYGLSFTEASADFGYASPAHFSTDIRSLFGKSPTELFHPAVPGGCRI